jgi:hypothetical protein
MSSGYKGYSKKSKHRAFRKHIRTRHWTVLPSECLNDPIPRTVQRKPWRRLLTSTYTTPTIQPSTNPNLSSFPKWV